MGLRPELLKYGIGYMEIVGAFAFFQAISLTISASLRSANKAIYPMLVTVLVNVMNIIGNYSLISVSSACLPWEQKERPYLPP